MTGINLQNLETFIMQLASQRGWSWRRGNGEYLMELATTPGRTQVVHLMPGQDPDGLPMLFIWSPVGPAQLAQRNPMAYLNYNTELCYGACAIFREMLVIKESLLLATADTDEMTRMIFHVARVADGLEQQAMGPNVDRA